MNKEKGITVCRLIFEFLPKTGGSTIHTIELASHINPYCKRQFLIVPLADIDTTALDDSFPFTIYRVNYCKFKWLHRIKAVKWFSWLPLAPIKVLSYGFYAMPLIHSLNKEHGIDIIHSHGITAGAIATIAGKLIRKPVVWMMHGTSEAYSKASGRYESLVTKLFSPDHCLVLDDGSPAPEKFTKLLKGKVTIVYHAIDLNVFYPKSANIDLLLNLGLQDSHFIIISTHSLIPVKGIDYAISAFTESMKICNAPDAILLILGSGQLKKHLKEIAYKLGINHKVWFLGNVNNPQIPDYLSIADIAIATSTYSNINRSVQEAMACGKPVVTFDSGNATRIIKHMETGLIAESGNVKDFAQKMRILHQNPQLRKEIGDNARKFIVENRSWDSRIRIELAVYQKLLQH